MDDETEEDCGGHILCYSYPLVNLWSDGLLYLENQIIDCGAHHRNLFVVDCRSSILSFYGLAEPSLEGLVPMCAHSLNRGPKSSEARTILGSA